MRIGVNDAAFHKPCDAFFSNDHGYCLGIREKIEGFSGERHLAVRYRHSERFEGWQVQIWRRVDEREPILKRGELSSGERGTPGCSGYVALNLAAQIGAKTIVLFGYDFEDDYRYFFAGSIPARISPRCARVSARWLLGISGTVFGSSTPTPTVRSTPSRT